VRIAVVHNFYRSASPSGENTAVIAQMEILKNHGHCVKLFSSRSDDMDADPLSTLRYAKNVATGKTAAPELVQEILDFDPEIVHVHNTFPLIGTSWLDAVRCPIVATMHNFRTMCSSGLLTRDNKDCLLCPEKSSLNAIVHACYRESSIKTIPLSIATRSAGSKNILMKRANVLIVLSDYSETIYNRYFSKEKKILNIPNFSPLQIVQPNKQNGNGNWVYVGRLSSEKGIMPLLANWPNSQVLDIYGSGELQKEVEQVARANSNINFFGPADRNELSDVLCNSRGLIFPSTCRENFPMIYVEALSSGIPIVAFGQNSVSDLVLQDGTGTVFASWAELEIAMKKLEQSRNVFRMNAFEAATHKYSNQAWYERIMSAYRDATVIYAKFG
jgi:glycosyltransferase involved in cell wall biosynthesis